MVDSFFYPILGALFLLIGAGFLRAAYIKGFRKGFIASVHFMEGRTELPREITHWGKALRETTPEDYL